MNLPLSTFYLSALSIIAIVIAIQIVKLRREYGIGLGSGKNESLNRQMRVQANLLENLLPFSILFILAELNTSSEMFLHLMGLFFIMARLLHAYGFSKKSGKSFGRFYGTAFSWLIIILLVMTNLYDSALYFLSRYF